MNIDFDFVRASKIRYNLQALKLDDVSSKVYSKKNKKNFFRRLFLEMTGKDWSRGVKIF